MTLHPVKEQFVRRVTKHFRSAGWIIYQKTSEQSDFEICSNKLKFGIKCLDNAITTFIPNGQIVGEMERGSNFLLRTRNQLCLTILSHNFLRIDLRSLESRNIFVLALDEISMVSDLVKSSTAPLEGLSSYQMTLLKRNVEYGHSVSEYFRKEGNYDQSLYWGETAVSASFAVAEAHLHLFNLYVKTKKYDEARAIGNLLVEHRGLDPRVAKAMLNFAILTGDSIASEHWRKKLRQPAA
jgi:hypothetical protein